jgi:flavin reductase (DIM6/NTAB) family NADH-FMN oxidoreductase RutF
VRLPSAKKGGQSCTEVNIGCSLWKGDSTRKTILSLAKVYRLLEPGPVVLLTTATRRQANVMPMSWHMMIDFEPPLVGCVVSNRNYSFQALKATKECVINIPTVDLAATVVRCGNTSGRDLDKFQAFGLTAVKASRVGAPMIEECFASLECRVVDARLVTRYNLFILQVIRAWCDRSVKLPKTIHHLGFGTFMVAGRRITLPSRMR